MVKAKANFKIIYRKMMNIANENIANMIVKTIV